MDEPIPGMEEEAPIEIEEGAEGAPPAEGAPVEGQEGIEGQPPIETPAVEEPAYVKELRDQIAEMKKQNEARAGEQPPAPQPGNGQPAPEMLARIKKDFGFVESKDENGQTIISMNADSFAKAQLEYGRDIYQTVMQSVEKMLHTNVSEIRTDAIISDLAVKTPEIRRYTPKIKEYLKDRYAPKDHANPKYIMDGLYWAKGQAPVAPVAPADRTKVRVMTPAPGSRPSGKAPAKPLGQIHRSMIGNQFKDENELRAWDKADLSKI